MHRSQKYILTMSAYVAMYIVLLIIISPNGAKISRFTNDISMMTGYVGKKNSLLAKSLNLIVRNWLFGFSV